MKDEAKKALEQLREAAADLGPEALDATLAAVHLQALSWTMFYGLAVLLYVGLVTWLVKIDDDEVGDQILLLSILFVAVSAMYFGTAAWMGLVSPEAALAQEVMSKF